MTPLTQPAVNANALETTVMALWQEFLRHYFDGNPHAVGATEPILFPKVELAFQQSALPQPLDAASGLAITLVWSEANPRRWKGWESVNGTRQEMLYQQVSWNFWVRASGSNARAQGKLVADRLCGLLLNAAETRALAQKGIKRLKPLPPRAVQESAYTLRLLVVGATLRFPILSQT